MSKRPTKAELRAELNNQIDEFISHGGKIEDVPRGRTALPNGQGLGHIFARNENPASRTPANDVAATIDARKQAKNQRNAKSSRRNRTNPKREVIYDDFGEPLRVVWKDH